MFGLRTTVRRGCGGIFSAPRRVTSAVAAAASKKTGYNAPGAVSSSEIPMASKELLSEYELWIGIEAHAQVSATTKLFSGAPTSFHAAPNSCVSLFDAALPGTLPRLNSHCVTQAARLGLALGGSIAPAARFDRKHYFYCDMPLGFQITQQDMPLVTGGSIDVSGHLSDEGAAASDGALATDELSAVTMTDAPLPAPHTVRIARIQLEQDSGKSLHDVLPGASHVDLNRAGSALMEIVSEPDMRSPAQATAYLRALQQLLRHVGASAANMEDGSLRCDVNVTVRRRAGAQGQADSRPRGAMTGRVELKNMNSLRAIARAISHEHARQAALDAAGMSVERETRSFDAKTGLTARLRAKEALLDYRFCPEPDLPPLSLSPAWVKGAQASLPPSPAVLHARLSGPAHGLTAREASFLLNAPGAAAFYRALVGDEDDASAKAGTPPVALTRAPRTAYAWLCTDLLGRLRRLRGPGVAQTKGGAMALEATEDEGELNGGDGAEHEAEDGGGALLAHSPVCPARLGALIDMVSAGTVTGRQAKDLLDAMVFEGDIRSPSEIASARGMGVDSDAGRLRALCEQVAAAYPDEVERYRGGRNNLLSFLSGQAIRLSKAQGAAAEANPRVVAKLMAEVLGPCVKPRKGG